MRTRKLRNVSPCYLCVTIPNHLVEDLEWKRGQNVKFEKRGESIVMSLAGQ